MLYDIFLKSGLLGCLHSIIGFYNILVIYLNSMEDVWNLVDNLNVMLLHCNKIDKHICFAWCQIYRNKCLIMKIHSKQLLYTFIINPAYPIGGSYYTILSQDTMIVFNMLSFWNWTWSNVTQVCVNLCHVSTF